MVKRAEVTGSLVAARRATLEMHYSPYSQSELRYHLLALGTAGVEV